MADETRNLEALASAARTATNNSADLKNNVGRGCHAIIDMTAITATGGVTFKIQGLDARSGKYYDLIESASIATVSTVVLKLFPGLTAAANLVVNDVLPQDFRVVATHGNGVSMTYSVSIALIK
jgi:hypothetical protein